jgi:RNA polymerase sigma factor (sigma-70 family)
MSEDQQLIARTLNGDMQAFRWLVARHERLVAHIAGRIIQDESELEEICQDIFLKAYDKLDTFRGDAKFSTWIASIAYRMSINHVKKRKVSKVEISEIRSLSAYTHTGQDELENSDRKIWLEQAIRQLPDAQRTVITLFHLQEMSYEEVAEITSMPVGTVKNYLFRGRKRLKELLENKLNKDSL